MKLYLSAIIVGAILGTIASKYLFVGSWLSLFPWTIAALFLGYFTDSYKSATKVGATYGFLLLFFFMITGYSGADPIFAKLWFFAVIAIFGAIYGIIVAIFGHLLPSLLHKKPSLILLQISKQKGL